MSDDDEPTEEEVMKLVRKNQKLMEKVYVLARQNDRIFTRTNFGTGFEKGDWPMDVIEEVVAECKKKHDGMTRLEFYLLSFGYVYGRGGVYKYVAESENEYPNVRFRSNFMPHEHLHPEVFNFIYKNLILRKQVIADKTAFTKSLKRSMVDDIESRLARVQDERTMLETPPKAQRR